METNRPPTLRVNGVLCLLAPLARLLEPRRGDWVVRNNSYLVSGPLLPTGRSPFDVGVGCQDPARTSCWHTPRHRPRRRCCSRAEDPSSAPARFEDSEEDAVFFDFSIVTLPGLSAPLLQRPPPTSCLQKLDTRRFGTLTRIQTVWLPITTIPPYSSQAAVCPEYLSLRPKLPSTPGSNTNK